MRVNTSCSGFSGALGCHERLRRYDAHRGMDDTVPPAELAKEWICDEDAKDGKAARYYADIVEH